MFITLYYIILHYIIKLLYCVHDFMHIDKSNVTV